MQIVSKTTTKQLKKQFEAFAFDLKYAEGIKYFEAQTQTNPALLHDTHVLYMLAFLYDHQAEYKEGSERKKLEQKAEELYQTILRTEPHNTDAIWGLGRVYWHRRDRRALDYAMQAYTVAKKQKEPLGGYMNIVGVVYLSFAEYKKAETWFKKALASGDVDTDSLYLNFLQLYKETDNKKKGRVYLEKLEHSLRTAPIKIKKSAFCQKLAKQIIPDLKKWLEG